MQVSLWLSDLQKALEDDTEDADDNVDSCRMSLKCFINKQRLVIICSLLYLEILVSRHSRKRYISLHVHVHTCRTCIGLHTCICVHTCIHTIHKRAYACMRACVHVCMHRQQTHCDRSLLRTVIVVYIRLWSKTQRSSNRDSLRGRS